MSPLEKVSTAASTGLQVFPLPAAVLLPTSLLPLHIFEPRYQEMVKDALQGDGVIAIAQLLPGWELSYHGRPPMRAICGVGLMVFHEEEEEGRSNIILQGLVRARIEEELPGTHLYREVRATLLPDPPYHGPEEALMRQGVLEMASRVPHLVAEPFMDSANHHTGGALADMVAAATVERVESRQALLEELDVGRRMHRVLVEVGEVLARLSAARPAGPPN